MKKEERLEKLKEIEELYKNTGLSLKQLGKQFGLSYNYISKFLKSKGIEIIKKSNKKALLKEALDLLKSNTIEEVSKITGINKNALELANSGITPTEYKKRIIELAVEEYINTPKYNKSIAKISEKYGINKKTLTKYLKLRNIEIINTGSKTEFNRDFFSTIDTEEKAYWLGFLYADGFISASGNTVGLSISLKDIDHLKKYNNALNYTKGLNITESHQFNSKDNRNKNGDIIYMVSTVIKDDKLWKDLYNKGCVPNKSLILKFPDEEIFANKSLIYDFIRGYVDGDGSLGVYPHSKSNPKLEESLLIVGTEPFLEGVQKYLGNGYLMQKSNCNKLTYRLGYSTAKAHKAADLLYKNASIYLDRKYSIYTNKFAALKSGKIGKG